MRYTLLTAVLLLATATPAPAADPAAAERQYRVARRLVAEGSPGAAAELRKVYELDPLGALADDALVEEALLLEPARWPEELGRLDPGAAATAVALLDRVVDGLPESDRAADAAYLRAMIRLEPISLHDAGRARRDLLAVATSAHPTPWAHSARYALAWLAEQGSDVARARIAYQRLIVDAPDTAESVRARVGLARVLIRDGRHGDAARWLQEAADSDADPWLWVAPRRELAVRALLASLGRETPPEIESAPAVGIRSPTGLVVLPDGGVVLADRRGAKVMQFEPSGMPAGQWALDDVVALAADGNAGLWAAAGDEIYQLRPEQPPRRAASQGELATVSAMAVDGAGGVWVVDRRGERVGRLDPGADTVRFVFETRNRKLASIAWDGRRLLAIDSRAKDLVAYDAEGVEQALGVQGLAKPTRIAVDAGGRAAVLDTKNGQVVFVGAAGDAGPLDYRGAGLSKPVAMAFGWDGVLHVFDDASGSWVRFR